jgi:hypothetical protein
VTEREKLFFGMYIQRIWNNFTKEKIGTEQVIQQWKCMTVSALQSTKDNNSVNKDRDISRLLVKRLKGDYPPKCTTIMLLNIHTLTIIFKRVLNY